jgi:putative nucleotidyltransferase with HDIG domain
MMVTKSLADSNPQNQEQLLETAKLALCMLGERDVRLKEHSQRVANSCTNFCEAFGIIKSEDLHTLYLACLLHDIGYNSVPNSLIDKTQALSNEEMLLIKKHPVVGVSILSNYQGFSDVLPLVRHHHEAFDGSGYPDAKRGEDIPIGARVIHLFDIFDKLTSVRDGEKGLTQQEAIARIRDLAGQEIDPALISKFVEFMESGSGATDNFLQRKESAFIKKCFADILQKFSAGKIVPPAMPTVVFELRNMIKREDTSVKDVSELIAKDPVISLRLISVARSPVYKGYGEIKSIQAAIPRLGFKETLSIVVGIANKCLYEAKDQQYRVIMDKMWGHSLACAYVSKLIAQSLFLDDPEAIFLMGLTHDIGKVVLLRAFSEVSKENNLNSEVIIAAIQEAHQSVGNMLLKRWGFGDEFTRVISLHEGSNFTDQTNPEILIVHLSNLLTRKMGFSFFEWDGNKTVDILSARLLGISTEVISRVEKKVTGIMNDVAHLF